ncbi:hypothetical protein HKX48_009097 [Thoreauomyces humboldtii]|nr:hypothetical protein HKX48_009097 [Thoreauomyces humboldtii]
MGATALPRLLAAAVAAGLVTFVPVNAQNVSQVGSWEQITGNSMVVPVHLALSPGGKLYMGERVHTSNDKTAFSAAAWQSHTVGVTANWFMGNPNLRLGDTPGVQVRGVTDVSEWDINAHSAKFVDHIKYDDQGVANEGYAFCGGHAQMADGKYLVVGGDEFWDQELGTGKFTSLGRKDIRVFTSGTATTLPVLDKVAEIYNSFPNDPSRRADQGRWYPSVITLPNEDIVTVGGHQQFFTPGNDTHNVATYEIFHPDTKTPDAPVHLNVLANTYPINLYPVTYVLPHSGNLWIHALNLSSVVDLTTNTETPHVTLDLTKQDGLLGRNFPFVGTNFVPQMSYRDDYKMVAWFCGGVNATGPDGNPTPRMGGSTDWYSNCPDCQPTARCNSLALETDGAQWTNEDMPLARSQPTAVNLPDGTVAIVSGSSIGHQGGAFGAPMARGPGVREAVIFNPSRPIGSSDRWTVAAPDLVGRHYHNTALLLEDGTIVTGGGDAQNGDDELINRPDDMSLDVFSPPYKSIPDPPQLVLPFPTATATYGQNVTVPFTSEVAETIKSVSIIRYASVTHSTNLDQRHIELEILKYAKDKLLVRLPAGPNLAQPGNWMLWAVDARGAPVARSGLVNIRAGNPSVDAGWADAETVPTPDFNTPPPPSPAGGATAPSAPTADAHKSGARDRVAWSAALGFGAVVLASAAILA